MKETKISDNYYFVNESGDPTFYDKKGNLILGHGGVSPILNLGFIKTADPKPLRQGLQTLRDRISEDTYLREIFSIEKTLVSFHAKDDCPEVREQVFKTILDFDFTAEVFVARKIPNIFNVRYHRYENEFYFDLVSRLFENKLHLASKNEIYLAVRGNKIRQAPLELAIRKAINRFETKFSTKITTEVNLYPQRPSGEPCLQIVDMYDVINYPKNYYNNRNKFCLEKNKPLIS